MVLMDFIRIPALSSNSLDSIVNFDESHVREAREQVSGAIIMSGHLGNWELAILSIGRRGYPLTTVVVRQRGPGGSFLETVRNATGSRTISKKTPTRIMLRLLKEGNFLGMAGDQDARKMGVWVTFFGHPSSRPRGPAVFALRTGAPMLFCWCHLQKDRRYQLDFVPINTENLPRKRDQAIQSLTQRYTDVLEEAIRRHPEQYFWFHRMWKTEPPRP
jgi:KDO2-lipid IV(A) lauroyltransferase